MADLKAPVVGSASRIWVSYGPTTKCPCNSAGSTTQTAPAANALAWRSIHITLDDMTATDAFDLAARENPQYPIVHGDLADRGEDNFWN